MLIRMSLRRNLCLAGSALALCAFPAASEAALTGYQAAVAADLPYEFHRFNETSGITAADVSGNGRNGAYTGGPTLNQAGNGLPGDTAVSFNTTSGTQYLLKTGSSSFGSSIGTSSLEFVFRVDPGFTPTVIQSLFGAYNSPSLTAISVDLNSGPNNALGAVANSTRLFIRGNDGDGVAVAFTNPGVYNGLYNHLVFTYNNAATGANAFAAYLNGIPQTLTFVATEPSPTDIDTDPDGFSAFTVNPTYAARNAGGSVGQFARVRLDEAALYTTVLSPGQVAAHAAVVPEPAALAGVGLAVAGLLLRRRRA